MQLDQIAAAAVSHFAGRLARRAMAAAVMALFVLVALYQFTVAGTLALEAHQGPVNARLIVAGIYVVLALAAFLLFWSMRAKPIRPAAPALNQPREMQLVMLVEAVMLGYSLARKGDRAR